MINLFSFSFIHAGKGRRFHCRSCAVFAVSVDMLSSLPAGRLMPHTFCEAAPEGRLGVRQLAAAFAFSLAILTHPKAQASLRPPRASPPIKNHAALGETPALPWGVPGTKSA
jgi:hypothetical protein